MTAGTVLHFSPHPDDELLGAPATLLALRDAGWRVVNVALSLGRAEQWDRRERELRDACERARFELVIPDDLRAIAHLGDGEVSTQEHVAELIAAAIQRHDPALVVSPSRHDRHPGHEVVGRAARDVMERHIRNGEKPPRWWMWGIWADLPLPTLITAFDQPRLDEILICLAAHESELARNPFQHLLSSRATLNAVTGCERVFGFGVKNELAHPYAELITEVQAVPGAGGTVRWMLGLPRVLNDEEPLPRVSGSDASFWMEAPSVTEAMATTRAAV